MLGRVSRLVDGFCEQLEPITRRMMTSMEKSVSFCIEGEDTASWGFSQWGDRLQGNRLQGTGCKGTGCRGTGRKGTGRKGTGHKGTGHKGTGHKGTGHKGILRVDCLKATVKIRLLRCKED